MEKEMKKWINIVLFGISLSVYALPIVSTQVWSATEVIIPTPKQRFVDNNGNALSGGKVFTYLANTTTKQTTYTDSTRGTQSTNPIILDSRGEANIWLDPSKNYKITLSPSTDTDPPTNSIWTVDNISSFAGLLPVPSATVGYLLGSNGSNVAPTYQGFSQSTSYGQGTYGLHAQGFVSVMDAPWNAKGDGITNDTTAINAAIAYGIANHISVFFSHNSFCVDQINVTTPAYHFSIYAAGSEFVACATTGQTALWYITDAIDFSMYGSYDLNMDANTHYSAAMYFHSTPGGGGSSRINIYNPTVRRSSVGIWINEYTNETKVDELTIYGYNPLQTPTAIYLAGSETGATFIGSHIVSEPFAGLPGAAEHAIDMEGGHLEVIGGSVVLGVTSSTVTILFQPASTVAGDNPYGILRIDGAHIETSSQLIRVINPRSLTSPFSGNSSIILNNVGGYAGLSAANNFITVQDTTYSGNLELIHSNFYAPSARSAFNISSTSPYVKVMTDQLSCGNYFLNWMAGVNGGILIHGIEPALDARSLGTQAITAGNSAILKFNANPTTGSLGRYAGNYSASTGVFKVPAGGFTRADISSAVQFSGGGTITLIIRLNGAAVAYGAPGSLPFVNTTLYNLNVGDTIDIYAYAYTNTATFDNSTSQKFQIQAATD
jgi:hypothetical protein